MRKLLGFNEQDEEVSSRSHLSLWKCYWRPIAKKPSGIGALKWKYLVLDTQILRATVPTDFFCEEEIEESALI